MISPGLSIALELPCSILIGLETLQLPSDSLWNALQGALPVCACAATDTSKKNPKPVGIVRSLIMGVPRLSVSCYGAAKSVAMKTSMQKRTDVEAQRRARMALDCKGFCRRHHPATATAWVSRPPGYRHHLGVGTSLV